MFEITGGLRGRILNSLTLGSCSWGSDVADFVGIPKNRISKSIAALELQDLMFRITVGSRVYLVLTEEGASQPHYDLTAPKARIADLKADYGIPRTYCIHILSLVAEARTCDISREIPFGCYGHSTAGPGQMIQQLLDQGVIREAGERRGSDRRYMLTDKGRALNAALELFIEFPDDGERLQQEISAVLRAAEQPRVRKGEHRILPALGSLLTVRRPLKQGD